MREYVNIRVLDGDAAKWLQQQALQAAQTKQELPDIILVMSNMPGHSSVKVAFPIFFGLSPRQRRPTGMRCLS